MNTNEIGKERIISDLKRIALDSEALLRDSADLAGDKAAELRERVEGIAERAKSTCNRLQDKADAGLAATDNVIREHPYHSLGLAAAVGLILGVLMVRK